MKNSILLILLSFICLGAFSANVKFQVDMNNVSFSGAVFVTGNKIDQWYGTYIVMEDPDGDGIYEVELKLPPGVVEFKYVWDNWANEEDLQASADASYCTTSRNGNIQRFIVVENEDIVIPVVCFGKCLDCASTTPPPNVDVTFKVDMNSESATNVYLTGNAFDNWCGNCIPMEDSDSDLIFEKEMNLAPGSYEFKFTKDGTWEEWSSGQPCTITNFGYHNRVLYIPMYGPTSVTLSAPTFLNCAPNTVGMTVRVDMKDETVNPAGLHLMGTFNGWDPVATSMESIGNDLWEATIMVIEGSTIEYKVVNGNSGSDAEVVPSGCANGSGNRNVTIGNQNVTLNTACFSACASCEDNNTLVWADEFDGSSLDLSKWVAEIGNGNWGWGNNELQYYTVNPGNLDLIGGELIITAKKESFSGFDYTSSRIKTATKADFKYGRVEARIKLPQGKGIWPAFWMMPADNVYGGWPSSGEIDIMEFIGDRLTEVHGTLHYGPDAAGGHRYTGSGYSYSPPINFSDDYHVYAIEWEEDQFRWFVDDVQFYELNRRDLCPWEWPFDQDFYIILNVAVGGNWPGAPDGSTQFPQTMNIDYVRVYQDIPVDIKPEVVGNNIFKLFPNPSSGLLNLSFGQVPSEPIKVFVYDILGNLVYNKAQMDWNTPLDISVLASGLYHIEAVTEQGTFVEKLVKK